MQHVGFVLNPLAGLKVHQKAACYQADPSAEENATAPVQTGESSDFCQAHTLLQQSHLYGKCFDLGSALCERDASKP